MMLKNNSIVRGNTFYSMIKSCSTVIFPLITFPYISRVLLTENVGKINFANSIVSYISLLASLGITTYAIRECSKVREDRNKLSKVASQIFSIDLVTTIFAYAILLVLLVLANPLYSYRRLIVILSTTILFTTLGTDWLNTSLEDFKYITIRTIIFQVLSLVLMFCFVRDQNDYIKYAYITVISGSGANIANIFYRKKYCIIRFTFRMNLRKHFSPILKLFAMMVSQQIFCNSDITILGLIYGDFEVGLYSTSVKIYNMVNSLISSITWVVMPELSYSFANRNYESINKMLRYALNFLLTLGVPCIIGLNLFAPELIEVVVGVEYIEAASSLKILSVSLAISLIWCFVMNIILLPSGRDGICLTACACSAVFNLITNLIFIPKFGMNAAAVTTTLSQLLGLLISVPFVDKEIRIYELKSLIVSPALGGVMEIVLLIVVKELISNLFIRTIVGVLGSAILYIGVLILLKNDIAYNAWLFVLKKINLNSRG